MAHTGGDQQGSSLSKRTFFGSDLPYPTQEASAQEKADWTANRWDVQNSLWDSFEHTWTRTISFIRGRHWDDHGFGTRITQTSAIVDHGHGHRSPIWRKRLVYNYTFAIWKTFISKLTKNRPAWDVRPASGDPEDVNSALLGRAILEWLWTTELQMGEMWRRAVSWLVTTGNVWFEVFWDNNTGEMVDLTVPVQVPDPTNPGQFVEMEAAADPQTGEPLLDMMGFPLPVQPVQVDKGQVGIAVHPPFAVRPNPEAFGNPDALTDVMVAVLVSRTQFARTYGEELAAQVDFGESTSVHHMRRLLEGMTQGHDHGRGPLSTGPTSQEATGGTTMLIRHYHKPDSEFPDGRFWVAANNGVMVEDEQPLPLGIWPLVHIPAYPNPGLLLSPSPLEPVIPLNRRLNEQNSKIAEHEALMVHGKWLVPKTANIRKSAITSEPGEVIEYTPPFEPKMADIKALPASIFAERQSTKEDMEFVSGIRKVSFGQPPPGVTAGRAFLVLQEADDTDLGPMLAALGDGLSQLGYLVLWTVRHFYTEERTVAITGLDAGEYMYRDFVGEDLDASGRGGLALQVKVQEGSMFPWLKSAAQEAAIQLMNTTVGQALLQDPETGAVNRQRIANLLQVGGLENLIDAQDLDVGEAERIYDDLARFEGGDELPQPQQWQNLAIHVERFERHLKSAAFQGLDPSNQGLVFSYYQEISAMLSQQQQDQATQALEQARDAKQAEELGETRGRLLAEIEAEQLRESIGQPQPEQRES